MATAPTTQAPLAFTFQTVAPEVTQRMRQRDENMAWKCNGELWQCCTNTRASGVHNTMTPTEGSAALRGYTYEALHTAQSLQPSCPHPRVRTRCAPPNAMPGGYCRAPRARACFVGVNMYDCDGERAAEAERFWEDMKSGFKSGGSSK